MIQIFEFGIENLIEFNRNPNDIRLHQNYRQEYIKNAHIIQSAQSMNETTRALVPSETINPKVNSQAVSETKINSSHSEVDHFSRNIHHTLRKLDEKTTQHALLSHKTSQTEFQSSTNQEKTHRLSDKPEAYKLFVNILNENRIKQHFAHQSLGKSRKVLGILSKLGVKIWTKLLIHLSKTNTADKYIRLVYSLLKLYRALNPQTHFSHLSKELLNTRRVLQWETKYQLTQQLITQNLSPFRTAYKMFELFATLFDYFSFLIHCFANPSSQLQQFGQILYQWQDDCYFYQCFIELILSTQKFIEFLSQVLKQTHQNQKSFSFKHRLTVLRQTKENLVKKIKFIKIIEQKNQKTKHHSERLILETLENRLQSKQTQIQNLIKNFKISLYESKSENKKQALRNGIKMLKYVCDCITSFNNHSRKAYNLNATMGGVLSILSSILSLYLIWM